MFFFYSHSATFCIVTIKSCWISFNNSLLALSQLYKLGMRPTCFYCSSGENRLRYFQLLMNGSYTPRTLPVGGEEARDVSPRSLAEALLVKNCINIMQKNIKQIRFFLFVVYLKSLHDLWVCSAVSIGFCK